MKVFTYSQRVYFSDTDAQGIVYHARYLDFAEHGRTEMAGLEGGLAFVVRSMTIGFEKPAYLDDMLVVETGVAEFGRVSMVFDQVIRRGEEVVCRMSVKVACIDIATGQGGLHRHRHEEDRQNRPASGGCAELTCRWRSPLWTTVQQCAKSMVSVNEEKELSLLGGYCHGCLRR